MQTCVIGLLDVRRTDWQAEYALRLAPVVTRHGGVQLAAGVPLGLEGTKALPHRLIVLSFPSLAQAQAWYADPDHVPLIALRQTGADLQLLAVEAPAI